MSDGNRFLRIKEKLISIGFEIDGNVHYEQDIYLVEEKFGVRLPEEYRQFLLEYGGLSFNEDVCFKPIEISKWTRKDGMQAFDYFYGLDNDNIDIRKIIDVYYGRMPNNIIPIAECPGGNQLCLGIGEQNKGKVYFWDHENELEAKRMLGVDGLSEINNYWDNIYLVSQSFYDFIMCLDVIEDSESNDDDIVEVWLSDKLLKRED